MKTLTIDIPEGLDAHRQELGLVFQIMLVKLNINRHKGFLEDANPVSLLDGMSTEFEELVDAFKHKDQFSSAIEACDVANMSVLLAILLLRYTKQEYKEIQKKGVTE